MVVLLDHPYVLLCDLLDVLLCSNDHDFVCHLFERIVVQKDTPNRNDHTRCNYSIGHFVFHHRMYTVHSGQLSAEFALEVPTAVHWALNCLELH